jgi:hypothetical protein
MRTERINQALSMLLDHEQGSEEYQVASFAINAAMSERHRGLLNHLVQDGPVWDGDVGAKGALAELINWGLATEICVKGEKGYTGANGRGLAVHLAGALTVGGM